MSDSNDRPVRLVAIYFTITFRLGTFALWSVALLSISFFLGCFIFLVLSFLLSSPKA